jgi:hypothetical protein
MSQSLRNWSGILRVAGATLFAIVLWGIVTLSGQFDTILEVPITVEPPSNKALMAPIPNYLRVRTRATGWNLLKVLATRRIEAVLRPQVMTGQDMAVIGYGRRDLLASIRTTLPGAQTRSDSLIFPDSLTLVLGPIATKVVPLTPEATFQTRKGFQVIGNIRLRPDSVMLTGARAVLDDITSWPTAPLLLEDVHGPVGRWIAVSDTLRGIVTPLLRRAEITADVQEVAERIFVDVPIVNRGIMRDSSFRLVLQPPRVEVLLRGGAQNLSRIDPAAIRAYVDITEGADTVGIAYPRILLPQSLDVQVVTIKPSRVRYFFRRRLEE